MHAARNKDARAGSHQNGYSRIPMYAHVLSGDKNVRTHSISMVNGEQESKKREEEEEEEEEKEEEEEEEEENGTWRKREKDGT